MDTQTPLDVAVLCARACELSYLDFSSTEFADGIAGLGLSVVKPIENAGVEAFAACNDDVMIICFRGTDSMADWFADAMAGKTPLERLSQQVHTGFFRTLMCVEHDINEFVLKEHIGNKKVYVTGHSLGAAMAVLYSMRWLVNSIASIVTFGCPRVGNQAFADEYNRVHGDISMRFVNNNDAVTRVPWKVMGYSHVFHQHYFDRRGRLHMNYRPGRLMKLWHNFAGRVRNVRTFKLGDGISDHSIRDYRRLTERASISIDSL